LNEIDWTLGGAGFFGEGSEDLEDAMM